MNARISIKNKKIKSNEIVGDIYAESSPNLKSVICPKSLNSNLIDDFVVLFLIAGKSKGVSYFSRLKELRHKESDRLSISSKILNQIGIKTKIIKDSIKIWGNPDLSCKNKTYKISCHYDHRIAMMATVMALVSTGGKFEISDGHSIATSFPSFLNIIKSLGGEYEIK